MGTKDMRMLKLSLTFVNLISILIFIFWQYKTTETYTPFIFTNHQNTTITKDKEIKVIYRVLYNGELVLPYIIEYLGDLVDEFIIIENKLTFSGKPNTIKWNNSYLSSNQIKSTIKHLIVRESETKYFNDPWIREKYTMNKHYEYIVENYCQQNIPFILYVADCDEILNATLLDNVTSIYNLLNTNNKPIYLNQKRFDFNFNWLLNRTHVPWDSTKAFFVNDKLFGCNDTSITLKNNPYLNDQDYSSLRNVDYRNKTLLRNSGIHTSWFLSLEGIRNKLMSFSHTDLNKEPYTNLTYIKKCANNGMDLFSRDIWILEKNNYSDDLPPFWEQIQQTLYSVQNISAINQHITVF